ncbi:tyrosine-type recombinase/integrase [Nocardioides perillae]|uniref:Integrase n=1 Tax=Nocardioides perillae TaxID=1119534 RepID=A0A7Y9RWB0_9ACTN|nr:integrase [Nocardioides perillae]
MSEARPGVYRALTRFRDVDGVTRRVTATARTEAAAERELKRLCAERVAPSEHLMTGSMKVRDAAAAWLASIENSTYREASTHAEYKRLVDKVINPALGSLRLSELNAGRCERFIHGQPTESRRKKVKTVLGMLMASAVLDGAIPSNPVRETSRLRRDVKQVRALSVEDLNAVRSAVAAHMEGQRAKPGPNPRPDLRDVIDLMLATGARIGEVLALRWVDVDLAAAQPVAYINGTIKTETGRGTYRKAKPKTDASIRSVELPPFAVEVLLRRRVEQPPNHFNAVFATRNGTWHQVGNMERRWRAVRKDAGLDWVKPHLFRKTVATLIDRLADKETAARQLGHSSSAITAEFYIEKDRSAPSVSHILEAFAGPRRTPTADENDQ